MRTSHIRINKLIKTEKSKITDKELFASKAYAAYLTDIAETVSKRYRRKIKVTTYWDESQNAEFANTNNSDITINAGNMITRSFNSRKLRAESITGMNAHEIGHVLYTDFKSFNIYTDSLLAGKFYPNEPAGLSPAEQTNLDEIKGLFTARDKPAIKIIAECTHKIHNILEDIYIESKVCAAYPGIFKTGIIMNNLKMAEFDSEITAQAVSQNYGISIIRNLFIQYGRNGEVQNPEIFGEYLGVLNECKPLIDGYITADTEARFNIVNLLTVKLWEYTKELIEKSKNDAEKSGGDSDKTAHKTLEDANSQTSQTSGDPSGDTKPVEDNINGGKQDKSEDKLNKSGQPGNGNPENAETTGGLGGTPDNGSKPNTGEKSTPANGTEDSKKNGNNNGSFQKRESPDSSNGLSADSDMSAEGDTSDNYIDETQITESDKNTSGNTGDDSAHEDNESDTGNINSGKTGDIPDDSGISGYPENGAGDFTEFNDPETGSMREIIRKMIEEDKLREATDEETERIQFNETDDIDEGSGGGTVKNNSYEGAGYLYAGRDTERLLDKIAEEKAGELLEKELLTELQSEAVGIRYGNAHKGIKIRVNRINPVGENLIETYDKIALPLLVISKRLQKQAGQVLKDRREGGKLTGLYMGRRVNTRSFAGGDGRIFYNRRLPQEEPDIAVLLGIDESGSMNGMDRITSARAASIIIYDFCIKLGIPVAVYGHSTTYDDKDVELYAYAEYDSYDKKDMYRMIDISSRNCNRDGAALRYMAERLMKRDEKTRLLILISDGQPNADGYDGSAAEEDLRGIKREYTNKGITMFNAAIGDDKENIKRIYGGGFLDITDLNRLPANLTSLISRYIK